MMPRSREKLRKQQTVSVTVSGREVRLPSALADVVRALRRGPVRPQHATPNVAATIRCTGWIGRGEVLARLNREATAGLVTARVLSRRLTRLRHCLTAAGLDPNVVKSHPRFGICLASP